MIPYMPNIRGTADFPPDPWQGAPPYVRDAARRKAKVVKVWRLYTRRGWNRSALSYELQQASQLLDHAIARWEHEETNPPLFR